MLSSRQSRRAQNILILTGLVLAMYYLVVFRPMDQRSAQLDRPLREAWQKLAAARISSDGDQELNIVEIEKNLQEVKGAVATIQQARETVEAAVALDRSVRHKMREPFQLVDFQIEELLRIEELGRSAQQNNVTIAPVVFAHFPEYQADRGESELLWGQLALLHRVLETAIDCKVSVIQSIQLPSLVPHARSATNAPVFLYEIPLHVELVGSMESITKLLAALPHGGGEKEAADLSAVAPASSALFIDRIVLRKNSPENPDEAHLDLRVCGFIYRENIQ
ncbi:MAG: hypothetical protein H0X66_16885 [Verrucomicrobia bacterium]|nr:hypothetical protein [Verrucomicrobiota bacterium]